MPLVIQLDFDPNFGLGGLTVRLETLALAAAVMFALLIAGVGVKRLPLTDDPRRLRRDDLLLVALGAVPGAVIGGRLDYVLIHLDYYRANPAAIANAAQGGAALTIAIVLGTLTALAVARLLDAPLGRWLHVAAAPLLVAVGLGKLVMTLGASGQGSYSDAWWATAYVRPGAWASANPQYPATPSQIVEGAFLLAAATLLVAGPPLLRLRLRRWGPVVRPGLSPRREWSALRGARRYLTALALLAVVRLGVAFSWRDASVAGPLGTEQLLALGLLGGCLAALAAASVHDRLTRRPAGRLVPHGASEAVEA